MTIRTSRVWLVLGVLIVVPLFIVIGAIVAPVLVLAWLRQDLREWEL